MISRQGDGLSNISEMWVSINRSVCIAQEQADSNILFVDSPPRCSCSGCSDNLVGQNVCLCVSPNLPYTQSNTLHETVSVHINPDRTSVGETSLVSGPVRNVRSTSSQTSIGGNSAKPATYANISPQSRCFQSHCMVAIDQRLEANGFSKRARKLLKYSWRSGTQKYYNSKYRIFCG